MLKRAIPVIGPPAAGKTTLTMQFGQRTGHSVFRLREHVPETILAATATSAERLGWIDDITVTIAVRRYAGSVADDSGTHTVLLIISRGPPGRSVFFFGPCTSWRPGCGQRGPGRRGRAVAGA